MPSSARQRARVLARPALGVERGVQPRAASRGFLAGVPFRIHPPAERGAGGIRGPKSGATTLPGKPSLYYGRFASTGVCARRYEMTAVRSSSDIGPTEMRMNGESLPRLSTPWRIVRAS